MNKSHSLREFRSWKWLYLPVYFQYLYYTIKTFDPSYLYDVNPSMPPQGGILKFSKRQILQYLDPMRRPKTIVYEGNGIFPTKESVASLQYPVIVKPDNEERGNGVQIVGSYEELMRVLKETTTRVSLIQEYIAYPIELGIFRYRFPSQRQGVISGVTTKEFTTVIGDGSSSLSSLIQKHPRARLYTALFMEEYKEYLSMVLPKGEKKQLNSIGNHCKGTLFLDGKQLINEKLTHTIQTILDDIPDFYYGRIDMRVASIEDLYAGKNIKIMEINGAQSEPTHMYDPQHSIRERYITLIQHWHVMYQIAVINRKNNKSLRIPFVAHMKKNYKYF